jgi:hypothetical protein
MAASLVGANIRLKDRTLEVCRQERPRRPKSRGVSRGVATRKMGWILSKVGEERRRKVLKEGREEIMKKDLKRTIKE